MYRRARFRASVAGAPTASTADNTWHVAPLPHATRASRRCWGWHCDPSSSGTRAQADGRGAASQPHSLTASQPQPHSLLTAAASQPHTNNRSSGRGRRTQRQWRAGLPRATATAAGHSVAVVTGVGVVVVLRAPMKWSPPAAAGCVEPSLRTRVPVDT